MEKYKYSIEASEILLQKFPNSEKKTKLLYYLANSYQKLVEQQEIKLNKLQEFHPLKQKKQQKYEKLIENCYKNWCEYKKVAPNPLRKDELNNLNSIVQKTVRIRQAKKQEENQKLKKPTTPTLLYDSIAELKKDYQKIYLFVNTFYQKKLNLEEHEEYIKGHEIDLNYFQSIFQAIYKYGDKNPISLNLLEFFSKSKNFSFTMQMFNQKEKKAIIQFINSQQTKQNASQCSKIQKNFK